MNRKITRFWAFAVVCAFALAPVKAYAASAVRTLKLTLNYTGTAKVDQQHKIFVLLYDANPYTSTRLVDSTSETPPPVPEAGVCHILRRETASEKKQTVTFRGLAAPTVYAMAFLDKTGTYDPHENPPSGSPVGVYGKAFGNAEPIALKEGNAVQITLTFDDSHTTP